ncbi:cupin domain-containing protein [Algoriphagus chordae]|uniref:Cupin domain-containing protein n=1 Tax=Algoriphagus chordae TaxID=237019 RepID=A0A2W7RAW3_9BACT|nr:hypothetical protein [Algoriphagus chordae]PZX47775.1 hypothetical protein LV85_03759 [Algoriphagus chordae]
MKINKEAIPVVMQTPDTIMRNMPGYGGMTIAFNEVPAGADFTPLLQGLHNNSCHCPHWGYLVEGAMRVIYDDGTEELLEKGDVFYMPNGHTAKAEQNTKIIDFSPTKEFQEVMEHIGKKMAEMG